MHMKKQSQAELIKNITSKQLVFHLYITQILLLTIALISSIFVYKDISTFFDLFRMDTTFLFVGILSGLAVVTIDLVMMKILPEKYYDDGGINKKLFANMPAWKIASLALLIAISEELLFRGMIQTKFGFIAASIIFALIHFRYWNHWYLIINIVLLSFWVGFLYEWSGQQLLPVIAMHFTIDFLLGLYISHNSPQNNDKEG